MYEASFFLIDLGWHSNVVEKKVSTTPHPIHNPRTLRLYRGRCYRSLPPRQLYSCFIFNEHSLAFGHVHSVLLGLKANNLVPSLESGSISSQAYQLPSLSLFVDTPKFLIGQHGVLRTSGLAGPGLSPGVLGAARSSVAIRYGLNAISRN